MTMSAESAFLSREQISPGWVYSSGFLTVWLRQREQLLSVLETPEDPVPHHCASQGENHRTGHLSSY